MTHEFNIDPITAKYTNIYQIDHSKRRSQSMGILLLIFKILSGSIQNEISCQSTTKIYNGIGNYH